MYNCLWQTSNPRTSIGPQIASIICSLYPQGVMITQWDALGLEPMEDGWSELTCGDKQGMVSFQGAIGDRIDRSLNVGRK